MRNNNGFLWCMLALFLLTPNLLLAGSFEVRPGVEISFADPPAPWQIGPEPPDFLIQERADSLHPPQLAAAKKAGFKTPEAAARKMLLDNELFLFNPQSRSHMEIDFSPLKQGERPATSRSLKASARYAAEELYAEEGLEEADADSAATRVNGAASAYRVDATFRKLGKPTRFIGIITFAQNHWIYLYYTGRQDATEDHDEVNRWLESIQISAGAN